MLGQCNSIVAIQCICTVNIKTLIMYRYMVGNRMLYIAQNLAEQTLTNLLQVS